MHLLQSQQRAVLRLDLTVHRLQDGAIAKRTKKTQKGLRDTVHVSKAAISLHNLQAK